MNTLKDSYRSVGLPYSNPFLNPSNEPVPQIYLTIIDLESQMEKSETILCYIYLDEKI